MKLKNLLPIIGIIILILIISTLDFSKIIKIFQNINPFYSFLCFFTLAPLLILVNIEWQILLRKQKIHTSFFYTLKNFFIGYFYGFITPGGFGAFTRALYLSDESGAPLPKCVSNIIIFNTVEFIGVLTIGAVGAIYLSSIYPYLFYIIIGILFLVIFIFVFFFKTNKSRVWFSKIVKSKIFSTIQHRIDGVADSFFEDIPRFKDVLIPLGLSIFGWILKYTMFFFIAKMFSIDIYFIDFLMIMAVVDVIASIPISIYGIGTREAALIPLFYAFNPAISAEQVVSLSLFWFVIIWLTPSVIGSIITLSESKKTKTFNIDEQTSIKFEEYMKKYPELYESFADLIKKYLPKKTKKPVIVELGVGPGLLSKQIIKKIPDADLTGIDPSSEMLKLARKNADIKTQKGSSEKIPFKNNSVDLIVTRFTLTYWKDPKKGFMEIYRVLKPNGVFIIEGLNKDFSKLKLFLIKTHMVFKGSGLDIASYHIDAYKTAYTLENVCRFLKNNGYKTIYNKGKKKDWNFIIVAKKQQ